MDRAPPPASPLPQVLNDTHHWGEVCISVKGEKNKGIRWEERQEEELIQVNIIMPSGTLGNITTQLLLHKENQETRGGKVMFYIVKEKEIFEEKSNFK